MRDAHHITEFCDELILPGGLHLRKIPEYLCIECGFQQSIGYGAANKVFLHERHGTQCSHYEGK